MLNVDYVLHVYKILTEIKFRQNLNIVQRRYFIEITFVPLTPQSLSPNQHISIDRGALTTAEGELRKSSLPWSL